MGPGDGREQSRHDGRAARQSPAAKDYSAGPTPTTTNARVVDHGPDRAARIQLRHHGSLEGRDRLADPGEQSVLGGYARVSGNVEPTDHQRPGIGLP